jgi:adenylylsulfate kinase
VTTDTRAAPVIWITGLPSAGKSSLARSIRSALVERDVPSCLLDGDELRNALVPSPGYDDEDRVAFYTTLANLAVLVAKQGIVALVPATANRRAYRDYARAAADRFIEVFVNTPVAECARRDAKGLYAKAGTGEVRRLPGLGAEYEPPLRPDVVAADGFDERAVTRIVDAIGPRPARGLL